MMTTLQFICENIDKTTRIYTKEPKGKKSLIGLPYPFTSPCIDGIFQEMYYWDTYFTNKGLLQIGKQEQAINNVRNFLYLLTNYGKIPNGNRMDYLSRSQPPFLGLMLEDVLQAQPNAISLQEAFDGLEKEYSFWQTKRIAPNGLNCYGCDLPETELVRKLHVAGYRKRTGKKVAYTVENAKNILCECESGWDFSPRFSLSCHSYNPVDLNCLLYKDEMLLSKWAKELGDTDKSTYYAQAAEERKEKILCLMRQDGLYFDYNFESEKCSSTLSCAGLFPYFVGLDEDITGYKKSLSRLERTYGVVACDSRESGYQWSAPNSWAPLNFVAFYAAKRLNLSEESKRIAEKYVRATDDLFAHTGKLWEKYNAENGGLDHNSEYGTPDMLGWTAGVYIVCINAVGKMI
jgi:alpha,alpha-trehalase